MSLQKLNAEFAPAPVRALLVDMDGVLFDTERRSLLSIIDIIGRQGLTITYDQLVERMGLGPRICAAAMRPCWARPFSGSCSGIPIGPSAAPSMMNTACP